MTVEHRCQVTRLFVALEYGEQLAHRCALYQADATDNKQARRFLQAQARQETEHASLFTMAIDWLSPKHAYTIPQALQSFGQRLLAAQARDDLTECLIGSQVVLEGFGEQILLRLNRGMDNYNIGFKRQRQLILRQEQNHHDFGLRTLADRLQCGRTTQQHVHALSHDYLHLIQQVSEEMNDVFATLDENAREYYQGLLARLPGWLLRDET